MTALLGFAGLLMVGVALLTLGAAIVALIAEIVDDYMEENR